MMTCKDCGVDLRPGTKGLRCGTCRSRWRKQQRKQKYELMKSLGITRVKGNLGGTYYE